MIGTQNHLIELEADIDNLIATEGSHFDSHAAMQANSNEVVSLMDFPSLLSN